MEFPKAFISYSHDSVEHKQWVFKLAERLQNSGIDVSLDLWDLKPGDDLPRFMETHLVAADKVLMVCTEKYVKKANDGEGGVGYEKMIVTADLMRNISSSKVIPLIRQAGATAKVPTFLSTKLYLNFSDENYEFSLDELLRTLHQAPLFVKPPIGGKPNFDKPPVVEERKDPIRFAMQIMVDLMEQHSARRYVEYGEMTDLAQQRGMSRIYFDSILSQLLGSNLIANTRMQNTYALTSSGLNYALEHKLA